MAIGVAIFIVAFFIFYSILGMNKNTQASDLKEQASVIIKQATDEGSTVAVVNGQELNISKFGQLKNMSYDELKSALKMEGDFCIYVEDENGNLLLVNNSYRGIGSPNINLSGAPCSQK